MFCEKTNGVLNIKILIIGIFEIDIAGMSENQNFAWKYFLLISFRCDISYRITFEIYAPMT